MLGSYLLVLFTLGVGTCSLSPDPTVDLGYSRYRGVRLPTGVDEYLGMRYAAPPVGNLRFRAPRDPAKTSTIQDASRFGSICIGTGEKVSPLVGEDCLFINVFTPSNATSQSKLPVWVHIQGGGYAVNSNANFNGSTVVKHAGYDMVFVNFNYRVGALGFLASERIRQDGDLNVGLLDQQKALQWVQMHIHQFGGNPDHVVIHGDSAGAGSITHHMTAYGGRGDGLFVGAIYESPFWPTLRTVAEMEFQFDRMVEATGCTASRSLLACLRSIDLTTFQAGNVPSPFPGGSDSPLPLWYFLPVIDGDLIQDHLSTLVDTAQSIRVPLLVGDDTDEGTTFAYNASSLSDASSFFRANYPALQPDSIRRIYRVYPRTSPLPHHGAYFPSVSAAYGDAAFTCPGNRIATSFARHASPVRVWNYRYNVQAPALRAAGLGVPHIFEISAIFGVGQAGSSDTSGYTDINQRIVPVVMDYWISFVKTLDPNSLRNPTAPYWEPWGSGHGQRLRIQTNATEMESIPSSLMSRCSLWRALATEMEV